MVDAPDSKSEYARPEDRRLTANLHLYWYSLPRDRDLPKLIAFNPTTVPALWPSCLLAIREQPESTPLIGDLGALLQADCPSLHPGLATTEVPEGTLARQALGCLEGALANRSAVRLEGRFRHLGGDEMLYRAIGLPFLDVRGHLTYALCAASGKKR